MAEWRQQAEKFGHTTIANAMMYDDRHCTLADMLEPDFFGTHSKLGVDDIVLLRGADGFAWAHVTGFDLRSGVKRPVLQAFRTDVAAAPESVKQTRKAA
jgi:hypothetical protein